VAAGEAARQAARAEPRLALLERIALAPRQSLALVEAEGRRFWWPPRPEGGRRFIRSREHIGDRVRTKRCGADAPAERGSEGLMVALGLVGSSRGSGKCRCCPI
jgi:hypothetical protein